MLQRENLSMKHNCVTAIESINGGTTIGEKVCLFKLDCFIQQWNAKASEKEKKCFIDLLKRT